MVLLGRFWHFLPQFLHNKPENLQILNLQLFAVYFLVGNGRKMLLTDGFDGFSGYGVETFCGKESIEEEANMATVSMGILQLNLLDF